MKTSDQTSSNEQTRDRFNVTTPEDGYYLLAAALWGQRLQPPDWHDDAACKDADPRLFDGGRHQSTWAKAVCADCPVRELCREDQLRWERERDTRTYRGHVATTRGGLTATERQDLHRPTTPTHADTATA